MDASIERDEQVERKQKFPIVPKLIQKHKVIGTSSGKMTIQHNVVYYRPQHHPSKFLNRAQRVVSFTHFLPECLSPRQFWGRS